MEKYIGTKLVEAEEAIRIDGYRIEYSDFAPNYDDSRVEHGYRVRYPDGYESWSPKAVFEEAYRPVDGMSFGLAIEAAKRGKKITRRGWNGKNQHIELASAISYRAPDGTVVNAEHDATGNRAFAFCGASGVQMGWLASQSDMLAEDWELVD